MEKQEMWIGNTKVLAGIDKENRRVHLLDLDGGMSLTNSLSKEFCEVALQKINGHNLLKATEVEFVCYHTDGMISKFDIESADFEFMSAAHEHVDDEFKKDMFYQYGAF